MMSSEIKECHVRRYVYKARVRAKCIFCDHRERVHIPYPVDYAEYAFTCTRCSKINIKETSGRGYTFSKVKNIAYSYNCVRKKI